MLSEPWTSQCPRGRRTPMVLTYKTILVEELARRKKANPVYSLRAFARDLDITAPQLSAVMNGRKGISAEAAKKLVAKLDLSNEEKTVFLGSATALHSRLKSERSRAAEQLQRFSDSAAFQTIQESSLSVVNEWFYLSVLQCFDLRDFEPNHAWIAAKLGISPVEAERAVLRLAQVGLLKRKGSFFAQSQDYVRTPDIPSRAIRAHLQEWLGIASRALEQQSIQERDFSSTVFAVDPARVPEFKSRLQAFREEFCHEASKGKAQTEIYSLSMQFFRVSKSNNKKEEI
jgi:uncharacterized protein (TIGR02147 family)